MECMAKFDRRLLDLQMTSFNGVVLWEISDYRHHFEEARTGNQPSLYSPPFYTSRHGYKMCAEVYLNGVGGAKGKYLSIFLMIMRGRFDPVLPWPFRKRVTFTLLNQSYPQQHIQRHSCQGDCRSRLTGQRQRKTLEWALCASARSICFMIAHDTFCFMIPFSCRFLWIRECCKAIEMRVCWQ